MQKDFPIAIVGAGQLGSAIGTLLKKKGVVPLFWDADPAKVPDQKSLEDTIRGARCVLFCVPSWALWKAARDAAPFLTPGAPVVCFAKGMEAESGKTMSELMVEVLPADQPLVMVGGPMLASDLMSGKKAIGVFASTNKDALWALSDLFSTADFAVELSDDPFSVSLSGVLKNIYAVGIGMVDGLGLGEDEKGWLASVAIREMLEIADMLHADGKIVLGTAGIGDFIATAWSSSSQNHQIGVEIGIAGICSKRGEGLSSISALIKRLGGSAAFPLLTLISTVGIDCKPARPAFEAFFAQQHSAKN